MYASTLLESYVMERSKETSAMTEDLQELLGFAEILSQQNCLDCRKLRIRQVVESPEYKSADERERFKLAWDACLKPLLQPERQRLHLRHLMS